METLDAPRETDVVVIGAGQAGLSSAYHLLRVGFAPQSGLVVLDADGAPGGAWRHRPPTLTMDKVHGIFDLPGARFALEEIDGALPAAQVVPEYFADYERRFELPVRRPVKVLSVRPAPAGRLLVDATAGRWAARAIVNATGTWTRPYLPYYPGSDAFQGRQLHSAGYRGPAEFAGRHVIVVGGGTSAIHVLSEVIDVAAATLWVTRRPPLFHDRELTSDDGRAAVSLVEERVRAGLPPQSIVSVTGLPYTTDVRGALDKGALHRLPMFDRMTAGGVTWNDGRFARADVIVWATGFRAALDHLAPLRLRERGGGIRMDGTRVVTEPRVHLVGYGPSASTVGANRAGRAAAREIRRLLDGALPTGSLPTGSLPIGSGASSAA